ncbi:hypothetical protein K439DRAFT_1627537 [Ramaria rubella]|nr:hypothetical protein K439DRAFT_1627537 [Ramaria rubella]
MGFLPLGNDIEMPNLKYLCFAGGSYKTANQTIRTPNLYFLRIVGNTASFANACHALRRLCLELDFYSFQHNTDASDILHACPNLEFLYWQDGMDFNGRYTSETKISLPFLTELEIHSSPRSSERMLRRLVTPSLETATLQPISNCSSTAQEQTMTLNVFLELNLEKLRELTLHHHDLGAWTDTESTLGDMMNHLPSLTTLCLVHCRLHRTFFNTAPLSRPMGRPSHGLEKIHLIFTTYYASDLAEFVRSCSMPDVAAAGLKEVSIESPSGLVLEWPEGHELEEHQKALDDLHKAYGDIVRTRTEGNFTYDPDCSWRFEKESIRRGRNRVGNIA